MTGKFAKQRSMVSLAQSGPVEQAWKWAIVVVALVLMVMAGVFWDTVAAAVEKWYGSATFNHCFLILPICGWLIWRQRSNLVRSPLNPSFSKLPILILIAVVWFLAYAVQVIVVQQLAFVAMVQAVLLTILGWRAVQVMLFPLGYLYFAVPFGEFLIPYLQDVTTRIVSRGLVLSDVPVFLDGTFIYIPSGTFEVAETCAGLRFLIATVALCVLFAYFFLESFWRRALFAGIAVVVPIVANGLRAYGIVMIAHLTNLRYAVSTDHLIFGWIFFSFVTFMVLGLGTLISDRRPRRGHNFGLRERELSVATGANARKMILAGASAIFVFVLTGGSANYLSAATPLAGAVDLSAPRVSEPWAAAEASGIEWRPSSVGADREVIQSYRRGEVTATLYIAYYIRERKGSELVTSDRRFTDGRTWWLKSDGAAELRLGGALITARFERMGSGQREQTVWYFYWIDGTFTSSPYVAKLLRARAMIFRHKEAAAVVAVALQDLNSESDEKIVLNDFLQRLEPIGELLERTASR